MSRESGPVDQFVIFLVAAKGAHALNSLPGSSTVECLGLNYLSLGGPGALGGGVPEARGLVRPGWAEI